MWTFILWAQAWEEITDLSTQIYYRADRCFIQTGNIPFSCYLLNLGWWVLSLILIDYINVFICILPQGVMADFQQVEPENQGGC